MQFDSCHLLHLNSLGILKIDKHRFFLKFYENLQSERANASSNGIFSEYYLRNIFLLSHSQQDVPRRLDSRTSCKVANKLAMYI